MTLDHMALSSSRAAAAASKAATGAAASKQPSQERASARGSNAWRNHASLLLTIRNPVASASGAILQFREAHI